MISQLPGAPEMTERLATWAERYRVPGATIAWMHGDESAAAAAGVLNLETGVEVTADSLFQIGSITKIYTTTLIMQLVDEGRVELDAPASKYLPGLKFGDATVDVTLRRLLTHTSGVDGDFFDDFGRGDECIERYVAACADLPQVFPVGAMWSYCNAGFVVLGRIIEIMTGMAWHRALKARLLDPIGATRTMTLPEEALLYRTSAGHAVLPTGEVRLARPWDMTRAGSPAGSTPMATVDDMLKFARLHIDGGAAPDGGRVLSEASVHAMREAQVELPAGGYGAAHWGLGWMLFDWGGRRVIGHDGGTIGQQSSLRILPEDRFAVAVLTNSVGGGLLANRIMRWLFGQVMGIEMPERLAPPESPPELDLSLYEGVFERLGFRTRISAGEGGLTMETVNTKPLAEEFQLPPAPLAAVDAERFLQRDPWGVWQPVVFSEFEAGRPRYLYAGRVARRVDGPA